MKDVSMICKSVQGWTDTSHIGRATLLELMIGFVTRDLLQSLRLRSRQSDIGQRPCKGLQKSVHFHVRLVGIMPTTIGHPQSPPP